MLRAHSTTISKTLQSIFTKTSFRPFSNHMSGMVSDSSPSHSAYQPSEDLNGLEWPEESLTITTNEGGGFYPARLGETFDSGRFVITRKLGWGGFSSVWLARDRKYVLENISLLLTIYWQNKEIVAMLPSKSSHRTHQEKLKLDGSGNAIFFERLQPQHLPTTGFNM